MSLIACPECRREVSDKAASCPHCGAPVTSSAPIQEQLPKTAPVRKTSVGPILLLLVITLPFAVWLYFSYLAPMQRNLPPMPVEVGYRQAFIDKGLVLKVKNTSPRQLAILATVSNPTMDLERSFRLDIRPGTTTEFGQSEGWAFASGDKIKLTHVDYQTWNGSIP